MERIFLAILLLLSPFLWMADLNAQVDSVGTEKIILDINGSTLKIPYFSNYRCDSLNNDITNAIVVIHGSSRNADGYYNNILLASASRPGVTDSTLIVAPQFLTETDVVTHSLDDEHLYWSSGGWKAASNSKDNTTSPRPERIPSFSVLDTLMWRLAINHPNLKSVVFVGHSAGGQVSNRYAATSPMVNKLCNEKGISMKFVVANPGSYVYLDGTRVVDGTVDQFEIPTINCNDYNSWKYGLNDPYTYPEATGEDTIRAWLKDREVIYLLGEADTLTTNSLDESCPAAYQGKNRLERGSIYYNYLRHYYGDTITAKHMLDTVFGIGHSSLQMFTSAKGVEYIFDNPPSSCESTMVGINSTSELYDINMFPNPAENWVNFLNNQNEPVLVRIESITGKFIDEIEIQPGTKIRRSTKDISSGLYLVEYVKRGKLIGSQKLIINK